MSRDLALASLVLANLLAFATSSQYQWDRRPDSTVGFYGPLATRRYYWVKTDEERLKEMSCSFNLFNNGTQIFRVSVTESLLCVCETEERQVVTGETRHMVAKTGNNEHGTETHYQTI